MTGQFLTADGPIDIPERVLVVVAHPDDIDFGIAGTVAELTKAGSYVAYCLVTSGEAGEDDMTVSSEELAALREAEQTAAAKVVGVTMLTSLDEPDLRAMGVPGTPYDYVMRLSEAAHRAGLDGVVCSGHEIKAVHEQWKDGFFVVPGLRPEGSVVGDQKRVVTPRQARDDGASVLVIGRPISRADDPTEAARAIEATL